MEVLLEIDGVKKYFKARGGAWGASCSQVKAVDDVALRINQGEHLGIVGESGSGKSTLARCVMKLFPMDHGRLFLAGDDYTRYSRRKMRAIYQNIQMVFQDPYSSLDPRFTVRDILGEAIQLVKERVPSRRDQDELMIQTLRDVQLSGDFLSRYPHEFSGGERQRIALARALIVRPRLLILDEAVSSLDVIVQDQILRLLELLARTRALTYLFISHNLKVVRKVSRRVAVMYQGRIVELADCGDIFQDARHPYTRQLLQAALDYRPVEGDVNPFEDFELKLVDDGRQHFARVK